jgi:hypothetical protein
MPCTTPPLTYRNPNLERLRGNDRDTLDIKTWYLQVSRLNQVQKLGNENTARIVMEALREQALHWALLLQDKNPEAAADWKLLQPLLIERFDKVVNETQKFKLIAALQQRQAESSKELSRPMQDRMVRTVEEAPDKVRDGCRKSRTQ